MIASGSRRVTGAMMLAAVRTPANDDVNHRQSSNEPFPTALHIVTVETIEKALMPAVGLLRDVLDTKARNYCDLVMVGRTHLQDATPPALGQMISGWVAQLDQALVDIRQPLPGLRAGNRGYSCRHGTKC